MAALTHCAIVLYVLAEGPSEDSVCLLCAGSARSALGDARSEITADVEANEAPQPSFLFFPSFAVVVVASGSANSSGRLLKKNNNNPSEAILKTGGKEPGNQWLRFADILDSG